MHTLLHTLQTLPCTMCTLQYKLYNEHFTVHTVHLTIQNLALHCTVHTAWTKKLQLDSLPSLVTRTGQDSLHLWIYAPSLIKKKTLLSISAKRQSQKGNQLLF